ncbi:MAG: Ig-like domain-containing protein [Bacteroidetes bacterium]|nr:Ig-like domain-containing protein [Bacteroidota bacterium]
MKNFLRILFVLTTIFLLQQCAQVGQLTGGKRDTTPPKLLEAVPANQSTNFNSGKITLKFDEFVQLKNLNSQLIVTPKLKTQPEVEASGKTIHIYIKKEELQPNTTYRLFFGKAIADMHEGNSMENFDYVFSTGANIDTIKLKGTITEAFNNKAVKEVLVGLYSPTQTGDSLFYKEIPDYMARGNENGEFLFSNLPKQTFKVAAFTDKNKNSLYDGEAEKIAFMNEDLNLLSDTNIHLNMFQEEPAKVFIKKTQMPYYGLARIMLNKKSHIKLSALNKEQLNNLSETFVNKEKDTVSFYYKDIQDTLGVVLENLDTQKTDTLKLAVPKDNSARKRLKQMNANISNGTLPLNGKIKFTFQTWTDTLRFDLSKINMTSQEDSLISDVPLSGRWLGVTDYELNNTFKEGTSYLVKIDTNAFFDIKGFSNDSVKFNFKTKSKIEFGKITLKMLFNDKGSYIVQLIKVNEAIVREQFVSLSLSSSNAVSLDFTDVVPDTYMVKIIFDENRNKKWDSGNLLRKKQAEKVIINSKQIKVLADWEMEEEILVKD